MPEKVVEEVTYAVASVIHEITTSWKLRYD